MSAKIYWTVDIQVSGGLKISESAAIDVDAYDMIEVTIKQGETKDVQIQPGELNQIKFLLIRSNQYGDASHTLTYHIGASTVTLDSMHVLMGTGAAGLLGAKPDKLTFTNKLDKTDAIVQILVGRTAS